MTFDKSRFLGAPEPENIMEEETHSDSDFVSDEVRDSDATSDENDDIDVDVIYDDDIKMDDAIGPNEALESSKSTSDHGDTLISVDSSAGNENSGSNDNDIASSSPKPEAQSRYPSRNRRPPGQWYVASSAIESSGIDVTTSDDPTLKEALSATVDEQGLWNLAIDDEFCSLDGKETWIEDDCPKSHPLPTHVILKVKRLANGQVDRFKARVVAGGNYQVYGENYMETHAPVVAFSVVRVFLYIALVRNMEMAQVDVKTAFLNGVLEEDIWVTSPRGIPNRPPKTYKLIKAKYGLKQAHLMWHKRLCYDLTQLGFVELKCEPCVFRRAGTSGGDIFMLTYVDDIVVLGTSSEDIKFTVNALSKLYDVRDSDSLEWFLGVQFDWRRDRDGSLKSLVLSQPLYVSGVLRKFGMEN